LYAPLFIAGIWLVASLPRIALLEHPIAVMLGEASYAMYLLQMPIMIGVGNQLPPMSRSAHFYVCLTILVAASLLVYSCFERPARSFIKKLSVNPPCQTKTT
jgi:peptidoglycan/LPS O-acetylase OafA/YrhL